MYFGELGQQGSTFTVRSQRGERPYCPSGSQEQSRHGQGLRESVTCYRAPVFAPPPRTTVTYHAPITRTTVSPAIQAQISPQVSPILTQAQASPGTGVTAAPQQYMPGGMQASGGAPGITAADLQRILADQRREDEARRAREWQAMQDTQQERADILAAQAEAERQWRAEQEANRAAAEAEAMERAQAMPPPPTAGAFVPPSPLLAPAPEFGPPGPEIDITEETVEAGFPVPWLLLAAAGVGTALLLGRKKGAKKR